MLLQMEIQHPIEDNIYYIHCHTFQVTKLKMVRSLYFGLFLGRKQDLNRKVCVPLISKHPSGRYMMMKMMIPRILQA